MRNKLLALVFSALALTGIVVGADANANEAEAYGYSCFVQNPQVSNEHVCGKIVSVPWAGGWHNTFHLQQLNSGTYLVKGYDKHIGASGWHLEAWTNKVDGSVRLWAYWTSHRPTHIRVSAHNPGWVNTSSRQIFYG